MIVVYVTYPSEEEAKKISKILIEAKLAACANIFPAHQSIYRWEGRVEESNELAVLYKTRTALFESLKDEVLKHHSYECPCIVFWPLAHGHDAFMNWIKDSTAG
jgi:periplasmic divalent cation tolerance protein